MLSSQISIRFQLYTGQNHPNWKINLYQVLNYYYLGSNFLQESGYYVTAT